VSTGPEPGDLHGRILDEAAALFERYGYHGLSMRQIAEASGVSKAGLYYHFEDKERLFLAILLRSIRQVGALVDEAHAGGGGARAQVERLLRAILTRMRGSQRFIRLAEQDASSLGEESRRQMHQAYQERFLGPIQGILREGVDSGELEPQDVEQTTWLLLGLAFSGLSAPPERVPAVVDSMVRVFFDGVAAR
jgi:AcrR family transcriptional regulator